MEEKKRSKMKIGELNTELPYCYSRKKPVWAYFENNYWTGNKTMCVLNINFKSDEFERLGMFIDTLINLKLKGVEIDANDVNLFLSTKRFGKQESYMKRYYKVFINVDIAVTTIQTVLKELNKAILKSVTTFDIKINDKKIEPLIDKGMVEMI